MASVTVKSSGLNALITKDRDPIRRKPPRERKEEERGEEKKEEFMCTWRKMGSEPT